ncbi:rhomboid family intramembrane serine protease [Dactylosporangium sp. NPDC000521]|uniref:rhomboid family intramembrane serine protease n=1 Tax=Dactylosporangium sp. NPDC000521 TaxID=3363975 RepID=UPI0036BAC776
MAVLYVALLVTAGWAGAGLRRPAVPAKVPVATIVAVVVVAVVSVLQLTVASGLFEALRRDRAAIGDGQVWRLVSSFVVQDSGWTGTVFNLVALAVLGTIAERRWGTARWLLLAGAVQVLGGLWGLVVLPVGAGSSLVGFGLAASLAAAALVLGASVQVRALGTVSLAAAVVLLVLGDVHGGAATLGAIAGVTLAVQQRRSMGSVHV